MIHTQIKQPTECEFSPARNPERAKRLWALLGTPLFFCLLASMFTSACSSSGSGSQNEESVAADASSADVSTQSDAVTEQPATVTPAITPAITPAVTPTVTPAVTPALTVELSPIELLFEEIRLAAIEPILNLNRKFQSGVSLSPEEQACIGSFDVSTGRALTTFSCAGEENEGSAGINVFNSDLQVNQSSLIDGVVIDSMNCQHSLLGINADACRLEQAEILLPVIWEQIESTVSGPIASVQPLQGAQINYNSSNNGILVLQSVSDLFVPFYCEIDIDRAALIESDLTSDDCQRQVQRLINRIFELRTAATDNNS